MDAFRVGFAVARYDGGECGLRAVRAQLRACAADFLICARCGAIHSHDKQRFVAHLLRIPHVLHTVLLASTPMATATVSMPPFHAAVATALLSDKDAKRLAEQSEHGEQHLLYLPKLRFT